MAVGRPFFFSIDHLAILALQLSYHLFAYLKINHPVGRSLNHEKRVLLTQLASYPETTLFEYNEDNVLVNTDYLKDGFIYSCAIWLAFSGKIDLATQLAEARPDNDSIDRIKENITKANTLSQSHNDLL